MSPPLVVTFGKTHPSVVTQVKTLTWEEYVAGLLRYTKTPDKASRGWSCPVRFSPAYRDSENFVERYALTFDYDHVTPDQVAHLRATYARLGHLEYTTWSHTAERPRWRFIFPLQRPVTYDEFQAISRKVASYGGIELAARESHTPAQMMYLPTVPATDGATIETHLVTALWVDPDAVLAEYENWTDKTQWPTRKDGDGVAREDQAQDPTTKPGIVGAFCRAYTVPEAIAKFELPYVPTNNPDRYTYTLGSRPEGFIIYDDGKKGHSHHDTDPARGQSNAFDLVRLHRFGALDSEEDKNLAVTQRPSFKAMVELAQSDDAVYRMTAIDEFQNLDETPEPEPEAEEAAEPPMARRLDDVLAHPTKPHWLLRDVLEAGTIVLLVGRRGSYKSFLALDWSMQIADKGEPVYVVSAEGGDFDRRAAAWLKEKTFDSPLPPLYVVERRLDLNSVEGIERIRKDCVRLGIRPRLFVLDTFSKLTGGLDENSNTDVKKFIGWLDVGLKRTFGATVLVVAHTGHSDGGRARGASALEADTEAAHIVTRDLVSGTVSVTRERFKSSPELPPLTYRPKIVSLDRRDEDGREVTSLVLEPCDPVLSPTTGRQRGKNQTAVVEALRELAPDGSVVDVGVLLGAAAARLTHDPESKRDTRRQQARVALDKLINEQAVFKYGSGISLMRAVQQETFDGP